MWIVDTNKQSYIHVHINDDSATYSINSIQSLSQQSVIRSYSRNCATHSIFVIKESVPYTFQPGHNSTHMNILSILAVTAEKLLINFERILRCLSSVFND